MSLHEMRIYVDGKFVTSMEFAGNIDSEGKWGRGRIDGSNRGHPRKRYCGTCGKCTYHYHSGGLCRDAGHAERTLTAVDATTQLNRIMNAYQ